MILMKVNIQMSHGSVMGMKCVGQIEKNPWKSKTIDY